MTGGPVEGDSPQTAEGDRPNNQAESDAEVAAALARVQEAVIDVKEGGLQESLEAAIEAIDSVVREAPDRPEGDQLNAVADALEEALDEVEKGKVANLVPVLEEARSIVETDTPSEA